MSVLVQSLEELDPVVTAAAQQTLQQLLRERYPDLEQTRGPSHDLIAFLSGGISGGIHRTEISRLTDSASLLQITQNPELADDEVVDQVLSNFRVTRLTGESAQGNITMVVTGSTSVVVPDGAAYTANGLRFVAINSIVALPPGSLVLTPLTQRVLSPRTDGSYEFDIPVVADTAGTDGNLRRGTLCTPDVRPDRFVTAFAASDFTGGTETESNEDLLSRLEAGMTVPVTGGESHMVALIRSQPEFRATRHYSVVGFGDPEMVRDQHTIFPGSHGGRVDLYARPAALPEERSLRVTATLLRKIGNTGEWQAVLGRDDAPGFYYVSQVRRPQDPGDSAGFLITEDTRGVDLGGQTWAPDVVNATEAIYSRYQTAVLRFIDTETNHTDLAVGDTAEYVLGVVTMSLLAELQTFLEDPAIRHRGADILVRGAVPCELTVAFDLVKPPSMTAPDLAPLQQLTAERVNGLNFPGELYSSQIVDAIADHLTAEMAVSDVAMYGRIRPPGLSPAVLHGTDRLRIPESPSIGVTPRTVAFFLRPEDVSIRIVNRNR